MPTLFACLSLNTDKKYKNTVMLRIKNFKLIAWIKVFVIYTIGKYISRTKVQPEVVKFAFEYFYLNSSYRNYN